jgi:hypothetical protein
MVLKVGDCEVCKKVLYEYRVHPGKLMRLTPEQELELLREWHNQGHPDMNARAKAL